MKHKYSIQFKNNILLSSWILSFILTLFFYGTLQAQAPNCANPVTPADGAYGNGTSTVLTWTAPSSGTAPTGYKLYLGTVSNFSSGTIVNGTNLGNVLTYSTAALTCNTTYYWQVVPTNGSGDATACVTRSFIIGAPATPTTATYGSNVWNVYSYSDVSFSTYAGFYSDATLSMNTSNNWGAALGPSSYSGYTGCAMPVDNFTLTAKRTNFTAATYQIDLVHDDDVWLFVNGTQIINQAGTTTVTNAWTGTVGPSTQIELRLKEGGGSAYLRPTFTVKSPATSLTAGTISSSATICYNGTAALTGTAATSNGPNACYLSYQWQSSPDNASWGNVSSATSQNYTTPALTSTVYYRRVDTDACGNTNTTNTVVLTVNPIIAGNTVTAAQAICTGTSPAALSAATPTGGTGSYTYQWESSITSSSTGFSAISGATSSSYAPVALTQNTWYRMTVTSGTCANTSTSIQMTVSPVIASNTLSASGNQSICTGQIPAVTLSGTTPTGGNGTYGYQWESSTTSSSAGFSNVPSATSATLASGSLTQNTWFRRTVNSGGCVNTSGTVQVTVNASAPGTPSVYGDNVWNAYAYSDNALTTYAGYYVENSLTFTSTTQFTAAQSPVYSSAYLGCLVPVSNYSVSLKRTNFTPGIYQVDVTAQDDNGSMLINGTQVYSAGCCAAANNIWTGTLGASSQVEFRWLQFGTPGNLGLRFTTVTQPVLTAGVISASQNICPGNDPVAFTNTTAATGCSQIAYQWQSSPDNSTWSDIAGATSSTYDASAIVITTYYRRKATDACGAVAYTSAVTVTVNSSVAAPSPAFGNGVWNVLCYQDNSWTTYGGYYTVAAMNFVSTTQWNSSYSPSSASSIAPGYVGCQIPVDYFSVSCKRTGFASGTYQIDLPTHDDDAFLYINGVLVFSHIGCCDAHTNVWTGPLNSTSTVEFAWRDGTGGSSGAININAVTPGTLVGGTIGSSQAICYGDSPIAFTNNASPSGGCYVPSYQWQQSADNSTWADISGAYGSTYTDTRSIYALTYYRRKATDICGSIAYSNTITVSLTTPSGTPSVFGSNTWNAYAYQDSTWGVYAGYYTEPLLSFDNRNRFTTVQPPSYASGYQECQIFNTIYSVSYKRQGVTTPGIYQIDIPGHDDDVYLYIDGVLQFTHLGCCDAHTNVWTGNLTAATNIELKYKNGNGPGYLQATFTIVSTGTLVGGTIGSSRTVCNGDVVPLSNVASASGSCTTNYQWQSSPDNSTWSDISGATASTYNATIINATIYLRRKATDICFGVVAYSNTVTLTYNNTPPGTPAVFGSSVWNAYAYNDNAFNTYRGYYTDNSFSFNSTNQWGANNSPSDATTLAPGYLGCQVPDDYFGLIYKRQGFTTGTYQIDAGNDDIGTLFIDGVQVYTGAYTAGVTNVWTGNLGASNTIEFRMAENAGGAGARLTFTGVSPASSIIAGAVSGAQTVCYNAVPTAFTSSSPASSTCYVYYQWQSSTDNSTWSNIGGATSLTYTSTALTTTTYFRRTAKDACGNQTFTASFLVSVNSSVNAGNVSGTNAVCTGTSPGTLTNTSAASGGNGVYTYQWQSSPDNSAWSNIGGATSSSYAVGSLATGTYYRINVTSCSQTLPTAGFLVTVNPVVSISAQPVNNTACSGNPASYAVAASGTTLTYQWQEKVGAGAFANVTNGGVYSGATSASLTISSVTGKGGNIYQVTVSGACGSPVTSSTVTLTENGPPVINTQPVSASICNGANTSFSIVAVGTGLSYQWQVNTGSGFTNISNGGVYAGATASTLVLTNPGTGASGYIYQCVVSSSVCSTPTTSNSVTLTVNPVIAANTVSYSGSNPICASTAVGVLTGSAPTGGGASGSYVYQWLLSTTSGATAFSNIAGSTAQNSSSQPTISQTTWYRRLVTRGGCSDTSTAYQLVLTPSPSVSVQPATATVCPGSAATFTVTAANAVSYQWQEKVGAGAYANTIDGGVYSGSTSSSLTISDVTGKGTNLYRLVVTGCSASTVTSSAATLNVPTVVANPSAQSICAGTATSFSVTAGGSSGLTYQWQVNTGSGFTNLSNSSPYSSVTTAALGLSASVSTSYNAYQYRAVLNGCTAAASSAGVLTVYGQISSNAISATQNICSGAVPNPFTGSTPLNGGGGSFSYQWQTSPDNSTWSNISGATAKDYSSGAISATTYFRRIATTAVAGCTNTSTPSINVTVNAATAITASPSPATVCQGGSTSFTAAASGQSLGYQWQVDPGTGFTDISNGTPYNNVTAAALSIVGAPASINGYQYRCKVFGNCPSPSTFVYTAAASLTVTNSLTVSVSASQSPSGIPCSGTSVVFTASPTNGGTTPSYQWKVNGSNVGANSSSYSSTTLASNDVVTVVLTSNVTCPSGNPATSSPITMTLVPVGTWLGGTTAWNTAANWCGGVPSSASDALIVSGPANMPVISAAGAVCRDLTVSSGASLTISGTNALSVYRNWSNSGTFNANSSIVTFAGSVAQAISGANTFKDMTISNASGGVQITSGVSNAQITNGVITLTQGVLTTNSNLNMNFDNGSVISPTGTGSISGSLKVNRNLTAGWHYLCSPLSGSTYADFNDNITLTTSNFYTYTENNPSNIANVGWTKLMPASTGTALSGQKYSGGPTNMNGYAIKFASPTYLDITGTYTHGSTFTTGTISYTNSGNPAGDGFHLVGNPYPSYINWNSAPGFVKTNLNAGITYYNAATLQNADYMPDLGMGAGEVYTNNASPYIPPMQAFWIQTVGSGASLTVNNTARILNPTIATPYAAPSFYRKAAGSAKTVKISAGTEACHDETVVRFGSPATDDFDSDFDMFKFKNGGKCPSLYSMHQAMEYSINSMTELLDLRTVALNYKPAEAGVQTLRLESFSNLNTTIVTLEDKFLNTVQDLTANPVYTFNAGLKDSLDRFVLHFSGETVTSLQTEANALTVVIKSLEGKVTIQVSNNQSNAIFVSVSTLLGQSILKTSELSLIEGTAELKMNSVHTGIYILKVAVDGKEYGKEIYFEK